MLNLLFGPPRAAGNDGWSTGWYAPRMKTSAGVIVDEEIALTWSAVWCATRVIRETCAGLPLFTYERLGKDDRDFATDYPAVRHPAQRAQSGHGEHGVPGRPHHAPGQLGQRLRRNRVGQLRPRSCGRASSRSGRSIRRASSRSASGRIRTSTGRATATWCATTTIPKSP